MLEPGDALEAVGQLPDGRRSTSPAPHCSSPGSMPPNVIGARPSGTCRAWRARPWNCRAAWPPGDLPARAGALAGLLTGRHGYGGDTENYDDPANANIIHVVERRRGLPVALGILWLHCTRAIGWGAHGIDFPGHFLVALQADPARKQHRPATAQQVVLDVFAGGVPLQARDLRTLLKHVGGPSVELRPGVLQPMSARRVLLRLQENVRVRRLRHQDLFGALSCTENMLRIAPDNASLWREAAMNNERLDHIATALKCYGRFLDLVPAGGEAARTREAMQALRGRLH